jgi:drug/metabolite transporter (DMT)-like permease
MGISLAIIFGIIAMLGYGLGNAISKKAAVRLSPQKTIFYSTFVSAAILAVVLLHEIFCKHSPGISTKQPGLYILLAILISIFGYIPPMFFYKALKTGKVGIITPVANSGFIFTVILALIFLGDRMNALQFAAIVVVFAGIILVSLEPNGLKLKDIFRLANGVHYAIIACLLWGITFFLFKITTAALGAITNAFIIEATVAAAAAAHMLFSKESFRLPEKSLRPSLFFIGLFIAIGTLFYNLGISQDNVSIVAAFVAAGPAVTIVYGRFVFRERLTCLQYLGALVTLAGIIALSLF